MRLLQTLQNTARRLSAWRMLCQQTSERRSLSALFARLNCAVIQCSRGIWHWIMALIHGASRHKRLALLLFVLNEIRGAAMVAYIAWYYFNQGN
jgi:hypothetical protein